MATGKTVLSGLINPEVMADMISASLPAKIKFAPLAKIDDTLVGQPGDTITVPKYAYIGDAEDVAEGVAMGTTVLTASTTQATIKKAGKAVEITDESVLSGYGDPVGEAGDQLTMSIAAKVDNDCITALASASLSMVAGATVEAPTVAVDVISYDGIVDAVGLFDEEDYEAKVLFVHPNQITTLRKDANFMDINKYPFQTVMTGVIGEISGCQVVPSKKTPAGDADFTNYIVKAGALTIYKKRDVNVEDDRDILAKTTVIAADEHYVAVLSDDSKVVKVKFKK